MVNSDFDSFLSKAQEISERQAESDRSGEELGYTLVTSLEAGHLLFPETPLFLSQARVWKRFSNTKAGIAAWEKGCLETMRELASLTGEKLAPAEPETPTSFPIINLTGVF